MNESEIKFKEWFSGKGRDFFIKNGVKQGFKALEFGAGTGNYTVPLAQAAGEGGIVYAAESDHARYSEIEAKLKEYPVSNVKVHDTGGIFSMLPKHRRGDPIPRDCLANMGLRKIKNEIKARGFKYKNSVKEEIVHDNGFVVETVINFIK